MESGIQERVEQVRAAVADACARSGRRADAVAIVAVSKKFGPDAVDAMAAAGLTVFGESKVQEAAQKIPSCSSRIEWHLVGHLQSNKVRQAAALFQMVHSVDSLKLLELLDQARAVEGGVLPVCLEVNVSGERSKFGLAPEAVPALLERCGGLAHVDVVGLMTVPPFDPEAEKARPYFAKLREWRDAWRQSTGVPLEQLSMGMSGDYAVAISEGATLVRLGTCIFGRRGGA